MLVSNINPLTPGPIKKFHFRRSPFFVGMFAQPLSGASKGPAGMHFRQKTLRARKAKR